MTDEQIAAKMPDGYYRVDSGEYKEGDLAVFTTASKLGFSPVSYTHVGWQICAPYVVARPMKGYKPEPTTVKGWLETLPDGYRERAISQGDKNWLDDMCDKGWLETLPDGYRERAISQGDKNWLDDMCDDLSDAIHDFQEWHITEEGVDFWNRMACWSIGSEGPPPLPEQEPLNPASDTPPLFPTGAEARKEYPVGTFIRDYFPHAIAALAHHSYKAQQQHGPATNGAPMEWLKEKSVGDGNQMTRHFMERDNVATAWRALEILERELTK